MFVHTDQLRRAVPAVRHWGEPLIGGFFPFMMGAHLGVVAADPETDHHLADAGLAFVRNGSLGERA